jgi:hypothetical protein
LEIAPKTSSVDLPTPNYIISLADPEISKSWRALQKGWGHPQNNSKNKIFWI